MSDKFDLLDRLTEPQVPEPPETLERNVHQGVNRSLLTQHVVDLFLRALPLACGEFARASGGLLRYTLTGEFENRADRGRNPRFR
jgi:hypothetical protein